MAGRSNAKAEAAYKAAAAATGAPATSWYFWGVCAQNNNNTADVHGHGARKSRYRQDNDLVWNPGAFLAAAALIGAVVLIGVLIEVA